MPTQDFMRAILPHPGPLPLGEGEAIVQILKMLPVVATLLPEMLPL
jgi:hypothetical protein